MRHVKTPLILLAAAFSTAAFAADKGAATSAREIYQQDRAACMDLQGDERKNCLREAGAAQIERRKGTLATGGDFQANLLARCEVHKTPEEKSYCERRMQGEGTVTGSVEGGGILRELVVTVPAEEAATDTDTSSGTGASPSGASGGSRYGSDSFSNPAPGPR